MTLLTYFGAPPVLFEDRPGIAAKSFSIACGKFRAS